MRSLLLCAIAPVACALAVAPTLAQNLLPETVSHYDEIRMFREFVGETLDGSDFDKLEVCLATIRQTDERLRSGESLVPQFYRGLKVGGRVRSADQKEYIATLERWKRAKPDSIVPLLALVDAYRGYGWDARGTGTSSSASETGWGDFDRYLDQAWETLQLAAGRNDSDPELYRQLVRVGRGAGVRKETLYRHFWKGVKAGPNYAPLYTSMAFTLLPRWYGGKGEVEAFAAEACGRLEGELADEMYWRIAWFVYDDSPGKFFESYTFDWERMKKGFAVVERKFPGSRFNANSFCRLAVRARDREVAAHWFGRLRGGWNDDREDVWTSERMFAEARAWAAGDGVLPGGELQRAVSRGQRARVIALLEGGADVNERGEGGVTPLIEALESYELEIALTLLEAGADPTIKTDAGWSTLESAANRGYAELVELLLDIGCGANEADDAGWTALHLAARRGDAEVVDVLLARGDTVVDPRDDRNKTPLHHAANGGHVEVTRRLLERERIEVDARDKWEWTPLHYAARLGRTDVAAELLAAGADVNAVNKKGHTPLREALRRDQEDMIRLLQAQGGAE